MNSPVTARALIPVAGQPRDDPKKNLTSFPPRAELFQFEILLYAPYYELPEVCMSM